MSEDNIVQAPTARSKGMSFVSVVVPAHNEENYLLSCLESIKNQDYAGEYEVIVVDNASTDNTAQIARDWGAKVVYEGKRSPACARQKGAEVATGKIIAFIDADTQAPAHWLSTIVWRFLCEPETVVISGPYAYCDAGRIARIASYGNFISIIIDQLFRKAFNKGSAVWGCNFAVRRSVLLEIGGFDTSIRFYGEEYELSLRLKKAGKGGIIPRLFVLTSARRLKRIGVVNQYWNWVVDYFSVLFWYKPISEELEDLPAKAWQTVVDNFSWQRVRASLLYVALFFGLLWLHISPVFEAVGRAIYVFDIGVVSTLFAYHGINPRSRFYGKVCSNGDRNCLRIALTFDDGPNEPYTSHVLSILEQYRIKATFFIIGQNARRYPETCRRIVTAGNVIGNHSYHHLKSLCLRRGKTVARDIEMAHQAIYECTGHEPKLFRPPHGFRTPWMMRTVRNLGYTVVTWDNMTSDWKAEKSGDEIIQAILRRAKPGGVIVLHDGRDTRLSYNRSHMIQALPFVIETLMEKGFEFVTIPELLESEGELSA
ncbi:MAG: glycosyltransferase [Dehalococcoidia bacterium]|jgi:peptidoglycan/xylan/chitin deacetylase (PgdA/CDA1 family)/GT2 family glycosyltransferase|nr:MAG: glycosyltransferase [Dehalococcoidia bacterium]